MADDSPFNGLTVARTVGVAEFNPYGSTFIYRDVSLPRGRVFVGFGLTDSQGSHRRTLAGFAVPSLLDFLITETAQLVIFQRRLYVLNSLYFSLCLNAELIKYIRYIAEYFADCSVVFHFSLSFLSVRRGA